MGCFAALGKGKRGESKRKVRFLSGPPIRLEGRLIGQSRVPDAAANLTWSPIDVKQAQTAPRMERATSKRPFPFLSFPLVIFCRFTSPVVSSVTLEGNCACVYWKIACWSEDCACIPGGKKNRKGALRKDWGSDIWSKEVTLPSIQILKSDRNYFDRSGNGKMSELGRGGVETVEAIKTPPLGLTTKNWSICQEYCWFMKGAYFLGMENFMFSRWNWVHPALE